MNLLVCRRCDLVLLYASFYFLNCFNSGAGTTLVLNSAVLPKPHTDFMKISNNLSKSITSSSKGEAQNRKTYFWRKKSTRSAILNANLEITQQLLKRKDLKYQHMGVLMSSEIINSINVTQGFYEFIDFFQVDLMNATVDFLKADGKWKTNTFVKLQIDI